MKISAAILFQNETFLLISYKYTSSYLQAKSCRSSTRMNELRFFSKLIFSAEGDWQFAPDISIAILILAGRVVYKGFWKAKAIFTFWNNNYLYIKVYLTLFSTVTELPFIFFLTHIQLTPSYITLPANVAIAIEMSGANCQSPSAEKKFNLKK